MPRKSTPTVTLDLVLSDDLDLELQPFLARDALFGLDHLLTGQQPGEAIPVAQVGAMVKLIAQGLRGGSMS